VVDPESLEQFEIHDDRSPGAIAEMIKRQGYDPVWKDWDQVLQDRPVISTQSAVKG
jgi:2-iminoacetate synthase